MSEPARTAVTESDEEKEPPRAARKPRRKAEGVVEFVDSITAGRAATVTSSVRPPAANGHVVPSRPVPQAAHVTDLRRQEHGQPVWRVQCGDLISRERCVTVFVDDDEVVLVGPPGETARLTAGQLGELRTALNEAAKLAER